MSTISERVQRGAAWLDKNEPGWIKRIRLDELVLRSCCDCVLGQVFDCYSESPTEAVHKGHDEAFGFNTDVESEWEPLQDEWRRVITERRAAA